jgi:hypothetical protein
VQLLLAAANGGLAGGGGATPPALDDIAGLLDKADAFAGAPTRGSHRLRAAYCRAAGQPDRARAEQRLADDPATPPSPHDLFMEGEWNRLQSGEPAGREYYDVAARRRRAEALERAVGCFEAALALDPADYWARFQVGRCRLALGHASEAVAALGTCVALRPGVPWGYRRAGWP